MIVKTEWYLMWCSFANLNWARLREYADGSADVFDMDGRLEGFATAYEARDFLWQDEFTEISMHNEEDERELEMPLSELKPPTGESDSELLPKMFQARNSASAKTL